VINRGGARRDAEEEIQEERDLATAGTENTERFDEDRNPFFFPSVFSVISVAILLVSSSASSVVQSPG
jgi:hypothetical protein